MDRADKISELRKRLEMLEKTSRAFSPPRRAPEPSRSFEETVGGEVRETDRGCCLVVERGFPLSHLHGRYPLSLAFRHSSGPLLVQGDDQRLERFNADKALYVDTETTGLAMGAGTYAFLIGAGVRRGDRFVVYQIFMRDFSEEAAQLLLFEELLKGVEFLVSYNGKSYDVPLIENRMIMSRMGTKISDVPHLDILHPTRKLWKHRFPDCRLATIERELMSVRRVDDIPGHQIPQVFFNYLKGGGRAEMERVFHHNFLDILSLALLGGVISGLLAEPFSSEAQDAGELVALGRLREEAGLAEEGSECYEKALDFDMTPEQRGDAMARLSLIRKRGGRWKEAISIWETMMTIDSQNVFPYRELAKYYEHQAGDFTRALDLVEEALDKARYFRSGNVADVISELEHRRRRLKMRSEIGGSR
jgi:uncharacterized protein YprB with RNaseH-like and TPR domain